MAKQISIGDMVKYSNSFCKSIGADWDLAQRKGQVVSVKQVGTNQLVKVKWDDSDELESSLGCNLAKLTVNWPRTFVGQGD